MIHETHPNRAAASGSAARLISEALKTQLRSRAGAALAVSGGSTPLDCFDTLSRIDLPWERVQVTLTDERCVPPDHPDSNQRQVRERLLVAHAARAAFVPVEAESLANMPAPFACVLAGMGEDGHFASLFPDAANLAQGLDLDNPAPCLPVTTAASAHSRISMTLSQLVRADAIVMLAFGERKRQVLAAPDPYPVGRLLQQRRARVRVVWAP